MKSTARYWVVASTAFFAVAGTIGVIVNLKAFADNFRWSTTLVVVPALAGIALTISMWIHYENALKESQSRATGTDAVQVLGTSRENADFQNKALAYLTYLPYLL